MDRIRWPVSIGLRILKEMEYEELEEKTLKTSTVTGWANLDKAVIFLHGSDKLFQNIYSRFLELSQLFYKKPDYVLLAQIIEQRKIGDWKDLFLKVLKDPEMDIYLDE